jgi:hypothetical protein
MKIVSKDLVADIKSQTDGSRDRHKAVLAS